MATGQLIHMDEIKNTWKYTCSKKKTDALAQEIYLAYTKLYQMKAIYLTNNEVNEWNEYIAKWEKKYKLPYIKDEDANAFTKRYREFKCPPVYVPPPPPLYTAFIRTSVSRYQIEPTSSLIDLKQNYKVQLRALVKAKEITKDEASRYLKELVELIMTIEAVQAERNTVVDSTRTTRPYVRRKKSA